MGPCTSEAEPVHHQMAGGPSPSFPSAFPATPFSGTGSGAPATGFAFGGGNATTAQQQQGNPISFAGAAKSSPGSQTPALQQPGANPFGFGSTTAPQVQASMELRHDGADPSLQPAHHLLMLQSVLCSQQGTDVVLCLYRVEGLGLDYRRWRQQLRATAMLVSAVPLERLAARLGASSGLSARAS